MRKWTFKAILVGLSLCSVVLVAGCGNKATGNQKASDGKVVLKVQSWQYGLGDLNGAQDDKAREKAITKLYEKTHPNVKIKITNQRQEDHFNALQVDFSANTAPDVVGMLPGAKLEQFKTQLEPLAPYAEKTWGKNWENRFVDTAFQTIEMSGKEIYSFPSCMSASGTIWTSSREMKKGGVSTYPTTWDDLKKDAATLKSNNSIPLMFGAKDSWQNYDMFITLLGTLNKQKANDVFALKSSWNNTDVIKAFDYYQKLFTQKIVEDGALSTTIYNEGYAQFRDDDGEGSVPMIFTGSWELAQLNPAKSFYKTYSKRGIEEHLFPSIEGNQAAVLSAPDVTWSINKNSKQKKAAWEFIRWMSDDAQQQVVNSMGFFSVLKKAPKITVKAPEDYTKSYQTMSTALTGSNVIGFREPFYSALGKGLEENLQKLATKQETPKQAAKAMQSVAGSINK